MRDARDKKRGRVGEVLYATYPSVQTNVPGLETGVGVGWGGGGGRDAERTVQTWLMVMVSLNSLGCDEGCEFINERYKLLRTKRFYRPFRNMLTVGEKSD